MWVNALHLCTFLIIKRGCFCVYIEIDFGKCVASYYVSSIAYSFNVRKGNPSDFSKGNLLRIYVNFIDKFVTWQNPRMQSDLRKIYLIEAKRYATFTQTMLTHPSRWTMINFRRCGRRF